MDQHLNKPPVRRGRESSSSPRQPSGLQPPRGAASAAGDAVPGDRGALDARAAPPRVAWVVRSAGVAASVIGGSYFVAWVTGIAARWSAAGVITMKTNMAFALVLAGVALALSDSTTTRVVVVARALAAGLVLATGLSTLCEHLFHLDLGIDQLLATEPPGNFATTSPNRFGIPGAVSLTLLGIGLLALRKRRRIAFACGLATLAITSIPAVGFLYRVGRLYSEAGTTAIAWPTVIALSAIGVGLMLSPPQGGPAPLPWRADPGGALLRRAWLPAVLVPVLVGTLRAEGERRGLYGGSVGDAGATIVLIVFYSVLLWRSAAKLSAAAHRQLRADDALRDALAQARSLGRFPEENPDPVLRLSSDLTVLYANEAALSCLRGFDLAPGQPAPEPLASAAATAFRTGERTAFEIAGASGTFSMIVVPVPGGGEVNVYGHDVSARKQAEEALREEGRRKSDFLGMLSHELRNPLAPIRNSAYILRHTEPGSDQTARALGIIERQTEHLTRLVDDLLDVTRIARGKIELRRSRIDLGQLVSRAADDFRMVLHERGIGFRVDAPEASVWANADPTRITQIVGNLVHNASKFTQRGDEVTVSLSARDDVADIRVTDTGAGIDPALLPTIFDPFVQGDRTLARTEGGLGLGLALVKGLTELHGGAVSARSAGKGSGTEFVVRLPCLPAGAALETRPVAQPSPGRAFSVLVVDDNVDAAETLADLLRILGHSVVVAYDGPSALQVAREQRPDAVLCDIGLPGMSGYEVAQQLRAALDGSVRLIAVSGYAQPEDVARALEAGFDSHVAKPADLERLAELLVRPSEVPLAPRS